MRLAEAANRQRLPISKLGVQETLLYLRAIDTIPLPGPSQFTNAQSDDGDLPIAVGIFPNPPGGEPPTYDVWLLNLPEARRRARAGSGYLGAA
jgi:hypothetical protein